MAPLGLFMGPSIAITMHIQIEKDEYLRHTWSESNNEYMEEFRNRSMIYY